MVSTPGNYDPSRWRGVSRFVAGYYIGADDLDREGQWKWSDGTSVPIGQVNFNLKFLLKMVDCFKGFSLNVAVTTVETEEYSVKKPTEHKYILPLVGGLQTTNSQSKGNEKLVHYIAHKRVSFIT